MRHAVSLRELAQVFFRIGVLGFGGPAGQIALMHRMLVEEKRWIGEREYLHALSFCMLLPGPEAQQLATYVGWLLRGAKGGLLAGILFVLPGALVMLALSFAYVTYADLGFVQGVFLGVKAAVAALVAEALLRIGGRVLGSGFLVAIAGSAFALIFFCDAPFPLIVLAAAIIGLVVPAQDSGPHQAVPSSPSRPRTLVQSVHIALFWLALWLAPFAALTIVLGESHVLTTLARFFASLAALSFGGAYAALAYMAQAAVENFHWLSPHEMLDGLGLAETTPGPLILVTEFVGFVAAFRAPESLPPVLAGTLGALLVLWVVFVPSFLWIFVGAPYVEKLQSNVRLSGALQAISAASVGVILYLAGWLILHTLFARIVEREFGPLRLLLPELHSLNAKALLLTVLAFLLLFGLRAGTLVTLGLVAALGTVLTVAF